MKPVSVLSGHATLEGSARYASRFTDVTDPSAWRALGTTALRVSRLGFGAYRVDDQTPEHRAALEAALARGVNIVDTSTNYTDGGSERLVGTVLAELVARGGLGREEVVVVSKIGYVQGQNLAVAQEREADSRPFPEMVKYTDGCWHCVHPEFLADQLRRSLGRLRLTTLDICLLHNPEYFLSEGKKHGHGALRALRDEFYRRLREAFRFLERQVLEGQIRWYGVSSNTCTASAGDPEATSLTRMLAAARDAGGIDHHFRVLQLPLNLFEPGAAVVRNNGPAESETVLDTAQREGIAVLVNRPLNALVGDGMVRLADFPAEDAAVDLDAQCAAVHALEEEFRRELAPTIPLARGSSKPDELFRWGEQLARVGTRLHSLEHWRNIEGQMIVPQVVHVLRALDRGLAPPLADQWRHWRDRYVPELQRLLGALGQRAARNSQTVSDAVSAVIDEHLPAERRGASLSTKSLWVVASTPGVTCVLNGMRSLAYVEDATAVLGWRPLADPLRVYDAARAPGS
jgi:aryl-alcohol dehydrogenase-like predicted oxidoreductase